MVYREEEEDVQTEALRILNDYTYMSQRLLKNFRQELLIYEKQNLERSTERYLNDMKSILKDLPPYIRIRYHWKEFRNIKPDSFNAFLFKYFQIFKSRITRKQAVYRIKTERIARYYLYHKRLEVQRKVLNDFYIHTFGNIIDIRKILHGVEEVLEKSKVGNREPDKMKNIIMMEKGRFKAGAELLEEKNRNFYFKTGKTIESQLFNDLQNFANLLDRPGANFFSKPLTKAFKNDKNTEEYIQGFADQWYNNIHLLVNKIFLDFLLHSLKNRIESKVRKSNLELQGIFKTSLINPLDELRKSVYGFQSQKEGLKKFDRKKIKALNIEQYYQNLFDDISALFAGIPLILSISGEEILQQIKRKYHQKDSDNIVLCLKL
jgi:hypothetical protein